MTDNEREKIKVQLSNLESFLLKSQYLKPKIFNKKHLEILNKTLSKDFLSQFEFNEKISFSETSVKYGILIQSINKQFNANQTIEDMYDQYLDFTKDIIYLNQFINILILIDFINTHFNNILLNSSFITNLINKKIELYDVSVLNNNNELRNKLELLYKKIEEKPTLKGNQVNGNLIILVYLATMGNNYYIDKGLPDLMELMKYFSKYNNIYINNLNLSIFLYLFLIITINLNINANKHKNQYLDYESSKNNSLLYFEFTENDLNMEINNYNKNIIVNPNKKAPLLMSQRKYVNKPNFSIPNLYLFDNESIPYNSENSSINLLIFQNYLKFYAFHYLSKNKLKFTVNLYIESIYDLLLHIYNCNKNIDNKKIEKDENKNENNKDDEENDDEKEENNDNNNNILESNIFAEINDEELSNLNLSKMDLFNKENISNCFTSFNFLGLSIFITGFRNDFEVAKIISINLDLIKKSKKWYLQESALLKEIKAISAAYNSTETLIISFSVLYYILETFSKNNQFKKNYPFLLLIKLNMFKCTINRDKKKQEIQIYFDYSTIREKILFHFLKTSENILFLISKYQEVINLLNEYKQYNCILRVSQTNFLSHQVSFYFKLITKILIDYIELSKFSKIEIYETKLNEYNPKMLVYIKNNAINKKLRIAQIKQLIHSPLYHNKIKIFQNFIEQLEDNFDIIVISNNIKEFHLLRTFDDNKLFIYKNKESSNIEDSKKNFPMMDIQKSTNLNNTFFNVYEYLNIIMYFKNDLEIYKNGLDFLNLIKQEKQSPKDITTLLPFRTTLICDRYFLESKVIVNAAMKAYVQSVYDNIDDLLLIAKCINNENDSSNNINVYDENFNYDVYINQKYIAVCNYHKYQYKKDIKSKVLIYDFLSVISSCIELIIYLLKYKDIYISKFIYIVRTSDDSYYSFEYKNSNIFFKRLKEFDSLISLDVKKSYPLLCLLSNKKETEYTESNNNFYDLFLRLFLNLNKVADDKEKLVQLFLQKVHKSIFYQYYDTFILTAFSYESINYFNNFFIDNNYLEISGGEKFDICNIVPMNIMSHSEKKNYKNFVKKYFSENDKSSIIKKICLFNYNFSSSYGYKNFNNIIMSFRKVEYFNNIQNSIIASDIKEDYENKKKYLYIKLGKKKESKKIFENIISFIKKGNFISYMSSEKAYEDILNEYKKERIKYKAQNVGKRIFQITENAKLDVKFNNNECLIY